MSKRDKELLIESKFPLYELYAREMETFADLIRADEREACAKVCENMAKGYEERSARPEKDRDINPEVARIAVMTCGFVEAAIRARGNNVSPA